MQFGSTTDSDFPIHYDRTQELPPLTAAAAAATIAAARKTKQQHVTHAQRSAPVPTTTAPVPTQPHPSAIFCLPTAAAPKDKLFFLEDSRPGRRGAQAIGYQRPAHMSDNMQYSLQWSTPGDLVPLDRIRPYPNFYPRSMFAATATVSPASAAAVADAARQRAAQSREEFLASFSATHAPLHHSFPTNPPSAISPFYPVAPPSSTPLSKLNQEREAERDKARAWLKHSAHYDPYPDIDPNERLPPSHYDAAYHDTTVGGAQKVSLMTHPREYYVIDRRRDIIRSTEGPNVGHGVYHGRNHRWTEEQLYYRYQQQMDEEKSRQLLAQREGGGGQAGASSTSSSQKQQQQQQQLMRASLGGHQQTTSSSDPMLEPVYSSFAAAAKRVEAKRTDRASRRRQRGVKIEPPRYARPGGSGLLQREQSSSAEAPASAGLSVHGEQDEQQEMPRAQTSPPALQATASASQDEDQQPQRPRSSFTVEDVTEREIDGSV